jgi:hypothetical protein
MHVARLCKFIIAGEWADSQETADIHIRSEQQRI